MKHAVVWLLALTAQCAVAGELVISGAHALATAPGQPNGVGYMQLRNDSDEALFLTDARSPAAARVEFHRHVHDGGQMRMEPVDRIEVPAGGRVVFEPGAYHLMLLRLREPLQAGAEVSVTLIGAEGREWSVMLPVRDPRREHHGRHH